MLSILNFKRISGWQWTLSHKNEANLAFERRFLVENDYLEEI